MFLEVNEDSKNSSTYEFIDMALKLFKQEPCEDCISRAQAINELQKICDDCDSDYCGCCRIDTDGTYLDSAKKMLKRLPSVKPKQKTDDINKSNFSQEQYKADLQCAYDCGRASVKPCEDAISRADAVKVASGYCHSQNIAKELAKLPPATPKAECSCDQIKWERDMAIAQLNALGYGLGEKPKTGHWFYDKSIDNWRCSECNETPKTIGYCGSANFMARNFKFCNNCGAKMAEPQESKEIDADSN